MNEVKRGIKLGLGIGLGLTIVSGAALLFAQTLNQFTAGDLISASQINANFTAVKTEITALNSEVALLRNQVTPIGGIVAWHRDLTGVPAIPGGWVECNGQTIVDAASLLDGQTAPNLNGDSAGADSPGMSGKYAMFLRGGTLSGAGQADAFQGHHHAMIKAANILEWHLGGGFGTAPIGADSHSAGTTATGYQALQATTDGSNGTPRTAAETRPVNMSVIWIMRIR